MPKVLRSRTHVISSTTAGLLWLATAWWRYFVTGRSVLGRRTDNATFWHAATKDYRDRPYERLSGPIWQRLARRWALFGAPVLALILTALGGVLRLVYWAAPGRTAADLPRVARVDWVRLALWWELAALVGGLCWAGAVGVAFLRDRRRHADFTYPVWQAACGALGLPYHRRDARRMVELPDGFEPPQGVDSPADAEHPALTAWAHRLIARRRLAREAEAIAEAAELEASGAQDPAPADPGAELERRQPGTVARLRGRLLDREPVVPRVEAEPDPVRIVLVPGRCSTPAQQKAFLAAVTGPLGMPDAKATWYLRGRRPYVELRPNLLPPRLVTLAGVRRHFEAQPLATPVIGLASGNRPVTIDFDNNSPHVMVSGGSGTGKSVLLKALLAQRMHNGAGVLMLDYKRVSHRWLHNLPGCVYAWRLPDIHDTLIAAGAELDRRLDEVLPPDNAADAAMAVFQTVDLVIEEINSTTMLLGDYWRDELGGSGQSPAVSALKRIVNMGREYRMHVWIAAQRGSASVFGSNGGDIRESFQTRLMAKWTIPTWKMLAGGAEYRRCPPGGRGIWARVQDDEVEIVRTPFLTDTEARDWATSGTPCPPTPDVLPGRADVRRPPAGRPDAATDIAPQLVTLRAALGQLPGRPLGMAGLRTAASKPGFPAPVVAGAPGRAGLYDLEALIAWKLERETFEELAERFDGPAADRRPGLVYAADVLDEATGAVVVGYVGQTRRSLAEREAEHRGDKPWADLVVGSFRVVWRGEPTDAELDEIERQHIAELRPLFNVEHQKGAPHQVPLWEQVEARHRRDAAAGRPRWVPVDVYRGERRPEIVDPGPGGDE